MPYGTLNVDKIVNDNGVTFAGLYGFKNRIINGAMMIDQRNAGASVNVPNATFVYSVDRFGVYHDTSVTASTQQSSTVPSGAGFTKSLLYTITTGANASAAQQNLVQQNIEGFNLADLGWGASGAASITASFWVRSSVTGTYGFAVSNSAANRVYMTTYTVSAANTWEYKTLTIPGDTTGTWVTDNGIGIRVRWDIGSGSNYQGTANSWGATLINTTSAQANVIGTSGATFYITGVQLEKGSTATSFDYRPYGTELALCQRYFTNSWSGSGKWYTTTTCAIYGRFPVTMRVAPTTVAVAASPGNIEEPGVANRAVSAVASSNLTADGGVVNFTTATATLNAVGGAGGSANSIATFSAEL